MNTANKELVKAYIRLIWAVINLIEFALAIGVIIVGGITLRKDFGLGVSMLTLGVAVAIHGENWAHRRKP